MNTITATDARTNWFKLLNSAIKGHFSTRIRTKDGTAILLSEEDYESILETAELLSVPGFKESIAEADKEIERGETYSFNKVFK